MCFQSTNFSTSLYFLSIDKNSFFTLNTSLNFQKLHNFSKIVDIFLNVSTLHMRILAISSGTSWWSNHLSATPQQITCTKRATRQAILTESTVPRTVLFTATENEFQQGVSNNRITRPMWYLDTILALDPTPSLIEGGALV